MSAPTQLAYRTSKSIGILDTAPVYTALGGFQRPEGNLRCACYSPDGRFFAWASPEGVNVIDASVGSVVTILAAENVYELGFSPLGTYMITWQRPSKDEAGNAVKNLKVWRTIDEQASEQSPRIPVGQYVQKSQTGWNLQYTADEKLCARTVTNEIQFYESHDLGTVWNKLRIEGVSDFALSPGLNINVAAFVPERKGLPAAVKVYKVPQFETAVSQKTFFKGDKVQLKWNDEGSSVIVLAQTEVDKSNKSYYGETNLYIMSANGGFDSRVQLDKEGPIHDVTWSPTSREFGVVYGYMPAKTTIFNQQAVVQHNFNLGPRNSISFSPYGRFVIVAGFGNLQGDMDIYDLEKNIAKICTIKASNASICEWSPDGVHILTATTSPRLRVDNGVKIYHVSGALMYHEDMHELYNIYWRPQAAGQFSSPNPNAIPAPQPSALAYLGTVKTPSKPVGAYRPPGARGTSTPLAFKREDEGGAAYVSENSGGQGGYINGFGKQRRREVPGAEPVEAALPPGAAPGGGVSLTSPVDPSADGLSKAALKNKKKRENRRVKDTNEGADGQTASGPVSGAQDYTRSRRQDGGGMPRSRSRAASRHGRGPAINGNGNGNQATLTPQIIASQTPPPPPPPPPAAVEATPIPAEETPADKKVRGLHKKLRAIEDLKMRQAGGEKLEDTQLLKIKTEESIRNELDALQPSS